MSRQPMSHSQKQSLLLRQDDESRQRSSVYPLAYTSHETVQRALQDPNQLTPDDVLSLQRSIGNRAVQRLLRPETSNHPPPNLSLSHPPAPPPLLIQPKLKVGSASDRYEQEADRIAQEVTADGGTCPQPVPAMSADANKSTLPTVHRQISPNDVSRVQASPEPSVHRGISRTSVQIPVIQRKRTVAEPELDKYIRPYGTEPVTPEERRKTEQNYDDSKDRGGRIRPILEAWQKDPVTKTKKKHTGSTITSKGYKTEKAFTKDSSGKIKLGSGRGEGATTSDKLLEESYPADYTNYYNPKTMEFTAAWNMKDSDEDRDEDVAPVSNSEIIWFHYKEALKFKQNWENEKSSSSLTSTSDTTPKTTPTPPPRRDLTSGRQRFPTPKKSLPPLPTSSGVTSTSDMTTPRTTPTPPPRRDLTSGRQRIPTPKKSLPPLPTSSGVTSTTDSTTPKTTPTPPPRRDLSSGRQRFPTPKKSLPPPPITSGVTSTTDTTPPSKPEIRGKLKTIVRSNIINEETNDTIFWCDGWDEAKNYNEQTVTPTDEDFWALLGSPNGNSAGWLLIDHGLKLGATGIEHIKYEKGGMKITYKYP